MSTYHSTVASPQQGPWLASLHDLSAEEVQTADRVANTECMASALDCSFELTRGSRVANTECMASALDCSFELTRGSRKSIDDNRHRHVRSSQASASGPMT